MVTGSRKLKGSSGTHPELVTHPWRQSSGFPGVLGQKEELRKWDACHERAKMSKHFIARTRTNGNT